MIASLIVSALIVGAYVWQDGTIECPDGARYTSGEPQPYPFHRRFCSWPKGVLTVVTLTAMVMLGALMGTWKGALLLMTLPGAWLIVTRPTTVDAPAMLAAWCSSLAWNAGMPVAAVGLACASGFIHERGPVYAAIYAWSPWPLLGLAAAGWWRQPAPPDDDVRVGRGFWASLWTHRQDHDWLGWRQTVFAMRGLPLFATLYGVTPAAWCALALGWGQRLICSDLGRVVFWAGPVIVRDLPDIPAWMVLVHAVTFIRMG